MKLLPEFALVQDIFDGPPVEAMSRIVYLRDVLLGEGLVRDLHDGAWARALRDYGEKHAPGTRKLIAEVIEVLRKDNRLLAHFARDGLRVEVCIWDKFHNRYFLSDLLGLQVGHGFFASSNPRTFDNWCRLSRDDRVSVAREFDENAHEHELCCAFSIGAV